MINPTPSRIEEILSSQTQLAVPVYQREYKWGKEEALDLIEDLKSCAEADDEQLFLGTIIFDGPKEGKLFIVDGQQRITTLNLLLLACRTRAHDLGEQKLADQIQTKITYVDSTTAEALGPRLIASESIKDLYEAICNHDWDGKSFKEKLGSKGIKRQVNRIKPVYMFFLEQVGNFDKKQLSAFLKAIYHSHVVRIDIKNDVEALNIFERTNARGLDLEVSDLLKNYLFSNTVAGIGTSWTQIVDNADGTMLRMLKYYYISKRGHVLKPQLYKKLKSYGKEVGPTQLTKELEEFSQFYRVVKKADPIETRAFLDQIGCKAVAADEDKYLKINSALEALKLFNVVQFCPLVFSACECFVRSNAGEDAKKSKHLVKLFETFEKYHFINSDVCGKVGNEVERLYADYSLEFKTSKDFIATFEEFFNKLRKQVASFDEFNSKFLEISYSMEDVPRISYIFDRFNNMGLDPGQRVKIYNPDPKVLRKAHNIEHFFPQTPEKGTNPNAQTMDVVDNIGNLLAIAFRTNSKLGNLSPEMKFKRLKGDMLKEVQNQVFVQDFLEEYGPQAGSWDKEVIMKRALGLSKKAYESTWAL